MKAKEIIERLQAEGYRLTKSRFNFYVNKRYAPKAVRGHGRSAEYPKGTVEHLKQFMDLLGKRYSLDEALRELDNKRVEYVRGYLKRSKLASMIFDITESSFRIQHDYELSAPDSLLDELEKDVLVRWVGFSEAELRARVDNWLLGAVRWEMLSRIQICEYALGLNVHARNNPEKALDLLQLWSEEERNKIKQLVAIVNGFKSKKTTANKMMLEGVETTLQERIEKWKEMGVWDLEE